MLSRAATRSVFAARTGLNANRTVAGRRFNTSETRGGKPKLVFRFGMKDIPVELYPLGFVVSCAIVAGTIASVRHFMVDGDLRTKPTGRF